jgi:hypothetical protein
VLISLVSQALDYVEDDCKALDDTPGRFISSQAVDLDQTQARTVQERVDDARTTMPFLFETLVRVVKLSKADLDAIESCAPPPADETVDEATAALMPLADLTLKKVDMPSRVRTRRALVRCPSAHSDSPADAGEQCVASVCSQVRYVRNRRDNIAAKLNGEFALVSSCSKRMHLYLHDLGLADHPDTTRETACTLSDRHADALMSEARRWASLGMLPHIVLDNIDMAQQMMRLGMARQSVVLHGSFAFAHFPSGATAEAYDLDAFAAHAESVGRSGNGPTLALFHPSPDEDRRHCDIVFALAVRALRRMLKRAGGAHLPAAAGAMPVVDQLPVERPKIAVLRLMDQSDNKTGDAPQLIDRIAEQLGLVLDPAAPPDDAARAATAAKAAAKLVQVIECDGGTAKLFDSARQERFPSLQPSDSLDHIKNVLGMAHVFWAFCVGIWRQHYRYTGENSVLNEGCLSRLCDVMGRKRPPEDGKVRDYNALVGILLDAADAEMVSALLCVAYITTGGRV